MPRGRKKAAPVENIEAIAQPSVSEESAVKTRKAYPSREERVAMADRKIAQLEKLNAERAALIAATEAKLNARKVALEKSQAALEKTLAKKAKVLANEAKPAKGTSPRAAAKLEEKKRYQELMDALKAKGKSLDDLLEVVNQD